MKEKREQISEVSDFLTYLIRSGRISNEGGDKIWRIILKHPEKADAIMAILDMELPESDTILKVERLV